jgi:serine protease Do
MLVLLIVSMIGSGLVSGLVSWQMIKNNKSNPKNSEVYTGNGLEQVVNIDENSAVIEAVEKVNPVVVSITLTKDTRDLFGQIYTEEGGGSGFLISKDGLILTNKHVVNDETIDYTVITNDGKSYEATVMSIDPINDLAIIKIDADNLSFAPLGDSDGLKIGQKVIAIGNALNEYQNTVTTGIVSAVDRTIVAGDGLGQNEQLENMIQTDAAINPGNSGGPLIDLGGNVIGINTAIDVEASNIGFAIPINQAKSAIESYLATGKITRPRLGIRFLPLTPELAAMNQLDVKYGALIYTENYSELSVIPGGPADKAGLQINDIIVSINNEQINEEHSLSGLLQKYKPGDEVEIEYWRKGELEKTKVILDEMK